ncbi:MAG: SDR family oxidoreductase [Betaproteobacteria bacterium]|nr:SDR family oxidoreductase [Betaproteobacteria bacterium]
MRLQDRVALITGGANGIGAACVRRFAQEGARVIFADRDAAGGAALAAELGPAVAFIAGDVTQPAFAQTCVQAALERFGQLDILLNNAGITHAAGFLDLTEADFDRVLSVNLKSYFLFGQAAARAMVARGKGGAIIHMSSVNAILALPDQVPYVVSKGAVNQLTKVMAMGLAQHGIRVNAIGPGTIATDLARKAVMGSPEARHRLLSRTPMGRLGEPDEVARVAVFLASEDASYMTGQTVYPDGGRLALNYTVPVADAD